jgi:transposase
LVDLEQHQPIDLLPDRSAKTFAAWLRDHPGVEVIARDRSTEYARGASDGAPAACQVADRWHLLKNHREALERMLNRLHPALASGAESPTPTLALTPAVPTTRALRPPSLREQVARQATRERRMERYHTVQTLYQQGHSILQIATRLQMSRVTVRAFATADRFPERMVQLPQPRLLDPYVPYLQQRWADGCTNASQLWREIQTHGYPGVRKQVARWAQQHRVAPAPTQPKKYQRNMTGERLVVAEETNAACVSARPPLLAAPRRLVWLLLRKHSALDDDEAAIVSRLQQHGEVHRAQALAQTFQLMIHQRTPDGLDEWLTACADSGIPELQSFAKGLAQEYASIRAALSEPWSSGQVEGQVTRLKRIKRQMYGRATFDLLKQRVLQRT